MKIVGLSSAMKFGYYLYKVVWDFSTNYYYSFDKKLRPCYFHMLERFFSYELLFFFLFDKIISLFLLQIAVFAGGVDTSATETKGTVLIQSAEQVVSTNKNIWLNTGLYFRTSLCNAEDSLVALNSIRFTFITTFLQFGAVLSIQKEKSKHFHLVCWNPFSVEGRELLFCCTM